MQGPFLQAAQGSFIEHYSGKKPSTVPIQASQLELVNNLKSFPQNSVLFAG